jgi:hypothetical protein
LKAAIFASPQKLRPKAGNCSNILVASAGRASEKLTTLSQDGGYRSISVDDRRIHA